MGQIMQFLHHCVKKLHSIKQFLVLWEEIEEEKGRQVVQEEKGEKKRRGRETKDIF